MGMRRLRVGLLVGMVAIATSVAMTATVAGAGEEKPDFSKLKPIKEPNPCKNDQGVTDDTIKVGVISIESGPQATSWAPNTLEGIKARVEEANASGELGDRTIELVTADDAGDPARNLTAAQQLNEQDKVFGIISMTNAAKGGARYLNEEGVPVGGWHVGEGVWSTYPNMFSWRNVSPPDPANYYTTRTAELLKKLGAKRVAIIGSNVESSAVNADQTATAVEETKGLELAYKTTDVTPEQQDFTGVAAKIKDAKVDGVYTSTAGLQANALSEAMKQAGIKLKAFVLPGGYDGRVTALPGYEGAYVGTEFKPLEVGSPGLDKYKAAMEAAGYEPQRFFGINGYLSANVFIEGLKQAGIGCPTRKAFINNLRLLKDYDADGLFLPVDYAEVYGRPGYCIYYLKIENKAFVPQFNGEPLCSTKVIKDGKVIKLTAKQLEGG